MGAITHIRQLVLRVLDVAQDAHAAIDSLPLPVVEFHLAPGRSRDGDAAGACSGSCASKNQPFFGYRLHLLITLSGVMLDVELTSATGDKRAVAAAMAPDHPGLTVLADTGYVGASLAEALEHLGVRLIASRRVNQHQQLPADLASLSARFRQIIETVNGQLGRQFNIEQTAAHSFWGCVRGCTPNCKLTAHTRCIYLNRLLGNPDWLQIKTLAFPNEHKAQQ